MMNWRNERLVKGASPRPPQDYFVEVAHEYETQIQYLEL